MGVTTGNRCPSKSHSLGYGRKAAIIYLVFVITPQFLLISLLALLNPSIDILYLYNSGYLIETQKEAILIDYIPGPNMNFDSKLIDRLQKVRSAGKGVYVMITHEHSDHFYPALLDWRSRIDGLQVIMGWDQDTSGNGLTKLSGHDSVTIGTVQIFAHPSTDAGSGFLVKATDFTFYHAGDHANWSDDNIDQFSRELSFVKQKAGTLDAVFAPIVYGKKGGCKRVRSITVGALLAADKLRPAMFFPMHIQCDDLSDYSEFSRELSKKFPSVKPMPAKSFGFEFKVD